MGKSDKKIKSDRINALRKQYDAFLEEDKRRKERNEYILGRLDKMRYCTTMVPMRPKLSIFIDHKDISSSLSRPDHPASLSPCFDKNRLLDIPKKHNGETSFLQEISKKYILIPKVRSTQDAINVQSIKPSIDDTADWKSKYEILDQLKRDEIESEISHHRNEYKDTKKSNAPVQEHCNDNYDINTHDYKIEPSTVVHKYELPERDIKESYKSIQDPAQTQIDNDHQEIYHDSEVMINHLNDIKDEREEKPLANNTFNFNLAEKKNECNNTNEQIITTQHINGVPDLQTNSIPDITCIEHAEDDYNTENNIESEYLAQAEPAIFDNQYANIDEDKDKINDTEKKSYLNENKMESKAVIKTHDIVNEINVSAPVQEIPELQDVEYPIEAINVQDFTPDSDVQLQDGVNINPTHLTGQESYNSTYQYDPNFEVVAENIENVTDGTSGMEALKTEQKDMLYTEQINENYVYNPQGVEENYDQGSRTQNEEYMQNPEGTYYDGAESEQYPVEVINEHEETTQLYDQNYEQQYSGTYAEQYKQEEYEQNENTQPYEPEIVDQTQQGIEQLHFEEEQYETNEQLEQHLDSEEGYVVTQDEHVNDVQSMEKNSEQQIADVKTS